MADLDYWGISPNDQQGNARIAFQNNGSGTAVVTQENSYYGLGMIMPNSPVSTPATPNKRLYNDGSEWQNDYSNLPDYYQTNNRNYDAAIGRFVGVDPVAESAASMTSYQYAGNNPIMNNDPMGNAWSPIYHPLGDGDGIAESGALNFGGVDDSDGGGDGGGGGGSHSNSNGNSNGNSNSNVSGSNVSSSNGATAADGPPTDTNVAINSPSTTPVNFNGVNALQEVVVSATSLAQSSNAPPVNFNGMNMLAEVQIVGQGNANQGGYTQETTPFSTWTAAFLPVENVGVQGIYGVRGLISVLPGTNGHWRVAVSGVVGWTPASQLGDVTFTGTVNLLINGKVVGTNALTYSPSPFGDITEPGVIQIGGTVFNLPNINTGNISISINAGYTFYDDGNGRSVPAPSQVQYNYTIPVSNP